ncbi:glycosyltransferase family 76 protein [Suhomyces tanzawaensis NRRL Y-17324]|uniref:GPI mannosyltransferase 2 n=1 Tax=Suhomyces tanzawaensis NRRL Y-17324 TaxID=984487 RepID=A0A1E4SN06_9ASCO|nr:glycosyltransferase family 76 protein [Suhomyces tanzawaensis NRRL Y-17324]ODV80868.1 glycosyltransferase family 76 protein [Suhomyces tanzawaensis NRRL Y-17324]
MGHRDAIKRLTKLFLVIKTIQLLIVYFTPVQFDTSSQILARQYEPLKQQLLDRTSWVPFVDHLITHIGEKFITWDAVYFSDLHVNPIKYENQFVFCPNWWRLIKAIPLGEGNFYSKLILSLFVSNAFHYMSALVMYALTLNYFRARTHTRNGIKSEREFAEIAARLVIISPAGIFLTSGYSENLSNFLSFSTIYLHDISVNHSDFKYPSTHKSIKWPIIYIASGLLLAYNFTIRANSIFIGIIYLYDLYGFLLGNKNVVDSLLSIIAGGQLFFTILAMNVYNYLLFCPERGSWCNRTVPLLFGYAQREYWGVGFLVYWSVNNIPNFLFATPTILIHSAAIRHYLNAAELPKIKKITILLVINVFVLLGGIFFWNTQILTRIGSFLPLSYWYVAQLVQSKLPYRKYVIYYMLGWNFAQTSLFAAFLPPA